IQHFDEIDTSRLAEGMIFGRTSQTYIAIRSAHALHFVPFAESAKEDDTDDLLKRGRSGTVLNDDYDLVQEGPGMHWFIVELSSADRESFEDFRLRVSGNRINFDAPRQALAYRTVLNGSARESLLESVYASAFLVDGAPRELEYPRFGSTYVPGGSLARKPQNIEFSFSDKKLLLDYTQNIRQVED
ncbi:MAG: hypothetical protein KKI09_00520, partial [Spirochaetes bacterium]|nr:hypothetical protein [Spirochaetota bacterium]